jgi:exopolyphosphatase/guanosine-5'-triphosphate,3'-diphosphate pyrophosphatase
VRLLELLGQGGEGEQRFQALVRQYVGRVSARLKQHLPGQIVRMVGTGGNLEAMAQLAVRLEGARRVQDTVKVGAGDYDRVLKRLQSLSLEQRIQRLGLKPDRADVIVPAALAIRELMRSLGLRQVLVPFANLRQGLLLSTFEKHLPGQPGAEELSQVQAAALQHAQRFGVDMGHARHVQRLALQLFDQLGALHKEDGRSRLILEAAALLHDSGYHISDEAHHKHSYYLVSQAASLPGFSPEEQEVAALVARYHRRSHPKPSHGAFMALKAPAKLRVRRLAALLRVADALDRAHHAHVQDVQARLSGRVLTLHLRQRQALELEKWAFQKKAKLFEEVFKCRVVLKKA